MKRELVNFVAVLGFILLGAAVILGVLTGVLFIFPNTSFFGAKAVNERDTQIAYRDDELTKAFANGKFIIESTGTQIEVTMTNQGHGHPNTIVVNESATGIAFNSLNRTLIEWNQTLYDDELYYRIKVLEPSGMVFNRKPTTVYLNLPYRDDEFHYDFVLRNQYSNVNFSFSDTTPSSTDHLLIDNLIVESAATVNFPYYQNNSLNHVTVKSVNTKLNCKSPVLNDVIVNGNNNVLNFGNGNLAGITGNVVIRGSDNQFNMTTCGGNVTVKGEKNQFSGTSANEVNFESNHGSLNMSMASLLNVKTMTASITVGTVTGSVTMTTQSGDLNVGSVGNGLDFTAGTPSAPNATALVNVDKVIGTAIVRNYGIGSVRLNRVDGDASVTSSQVSGGEIYVSFMEGSGVHNLTINGYDGNITARNLNGGIVNIAVPENRAGAANIYAHFVKVGTAEIHSGGYIDGHDDWGNVHIELANGCNNLDFYVFYARSANTSAQYGYDQNNLSINQEANGGVYNHVVVNSETTDDDGTLKVYSHNKVNLS